MADEQSFLGAHTCIPTLLKNPSSLSSILYGNTKLPPYAICTGHGQRVKDCLKYLENGVLLKSLEISRVEIAVGLYKSTPVVIFEHQVGPSPVEVFCREILSQELMTNYFNLYSYNNTMIKSDAKYIIRLGTSLGINNNYETRGIHVNIGDINICNKQVGISSVDFQAITSNLNPLHYHTRDVNKTIKYLKDCGYTVNIDDNNEIWPTIHFDQHLKNTLLQCTKHNLYNLRKHKNENHNQVISLNNVSKDSLYAEESESAFYKLRKLYDVATSEMETATMLRLSKELEKKYNNKIKVGASLLIVGVIPGSSFGVLTNKQHLSDIQWISTLDALHEISKQHIYKESVPEQLIYSEAALDIVTNPFLVGPPLLSLAKTSSKDFVRFLKLDTQNAFDIQPPFVCLSILRGGRYYQLHEAWNEVYGGDNKLLLAEIRASRSCDANGNWFAEIWYDSSLSKMSEIESYDNLLSANTIVIGDTIATASTLRSVLEWLVKLRVQNNSSDKKLKIVVWSICGSWIAKYNLYDFYVNQLLPNNIEMQIVLANAGYTLDEINGTDLSLISAEILEDAKQFIEDRIGAQFIKNMKCAVWDWGERFNDIQHHLKEINAYFSRFKPYALPQHIRNHLLLYKKAHLSKL